MAIKHSFTPSESNPVSLAQWVDDHVIDDGSLTIAKTTGLQAALDGKQPLATVLTNTTASFTTALETKLNGIEAGAEVNSVDSVAGKTGVITLTRSDVGLGNVDNTSDANKPVSTATQTALNAKQDTLVSGTNIKTINGASVLGSGDLTVTGGSYTDEQAQDAVGTILTDSGEIDFTYDDATPSITASLKTGIDATKIADGSVSNTEFQYLNGVTSDIQTQLNAKPSFTYSEAAQAQLTSTITWTGSSAPSGVTTHRYWWQRVGSTVHLWIQVFHASTGSGLTRVAVDLPSDLPQPMEPDAMDAANARIQVVNGIVKGSATDDGAASRCYLARDSGDTKWQVIAVASSGSYRVAQFTVTYRCV